MNPTTLILRLQLLHLIWADKKKDLVFLKKKNYLDLVIMIIPRLSEVKIRKHSQLARDYVKKMEILILGQVIMNPS
jgi:hypothetical protein